MCIILYFVLLSFKLSKVSIFSQTHKSKFVTFFVFFMYLGYQLPCAEEGGHKVNSSISATTTVQIHIMA